MKATEAADIIATEMRVFARRHGLELTKDLAEARVSELRGPNYANSLHGQAAKVANPRTVLRIAALQGRLI